MSNNGQHYHRIEENVDKRDNWARRRRKGIPNDRQLMVVACMDERIPVEEALNIELGDAHIFRNAGGKVTDDVIRSAALTTNFFDTKEIIVLNHTDCGMMSAPDSAIADGLKQQAGGSLENIDLNPALPELDIGDASIEDWVYMTDDIDEAAQQQIEYLRNHQLIPDDVEVHGYIYEVESGELRRPKERISPEINSRNGS